MFHFLSTIFNPKFPTSLRSCSNLAVAQNSIITTTLQLTATVISASMPEAAVVNQNISTVLVISIPDGSNGGNSNSISPRMGSLGGLTTTAGFGVQKV